jgi:hypothetical protein
MATVYLAEVRKRRRQVAIKVLSAVARRIEPRRIASIAALPFEHLSSNPSREYFVRTTAPGVTGWRFTAKRRGLSQRRFEWS